MATFQQYVNDLKREGKKQIVIRSSQTLAWSSGFAHFLMANFDHRKLNKSDDFVAYI